MFEASRRRLPERWYRYGITSSLLYTENPRLGRGVQERLHLYVLNKKTPFDIIEVRLPTAQKISKGGPYEGHT